MIKLNTVNTLNCVYIKLWGKGEGNMKNLNKCLLVSFVLGIIYAIYIVAYFGGAVGDSEGAEQVGAAFATALVTPHMICTILAVIFNGLGLFMNKRGFALTGAILYAVAIVMFIPYFMFVIIQMILSFVGFAKLKNVA